MEICILALNCLVLYDLQRSWIYDQDPDLI